MEKKPDSFEEAVKEMLFKFWDEDDAPLIPTWRELYFDAFNRWGEQCLRVFRFWGLNWWERRDG